jgi:glutamate-1-semialdehyde 2,1-aminomutase
MKQRSIKNSELLKKRAQKVIPHLTGTFSRAAPSFVEGVYPVFAKSAKGAHFLDVDGNKYLDYLCGLGPITLGYNYKIVDDAIKKQLKNGIIFSLPHSLEVECSELMTKTIPFAEMVKFEKTGSNAVTGAVRAARFITKREKIAYCGSGGVWHDWQAAMVSRDGGVPKFNEKLIKIFNYNDSEGLEQIMEDNKGEIACIVLEPTIYEKPKNDFLKKIRKIANQNDSLLILDEMVTGFRFDLGGGQKLFNVKGDFACFGKGMGNGLPISAITGPTEFMKSFDELWVSSTNNSEALSLAGTIATINEMKNKKTIKYCWKMGKKLFDEWNKISNKWNINSKMSGYPIRMKLQSYDLEGNESNSLKALILQELIKKGIFMSPGVCFLSYSHSIKDIENTLKSFDEICKWIKGLNNEKYEKYLEGKVPTKIWSMKIKPTKKILINPKRLK